MMSTGVKFGLPRSARYMLFSALGFAMMAATVKLLSQRGIPVLEILAARALVSLLLSYFDIKRKGLSVWGNNPLLLFSRGLSGSIALLGLFYAISTLPLAEATILQYLNPIFTALFALLFLAEPIQRATLVCITLSMLGLFVIVQPELIFSDYQQELTMLSILAGLLGAFGSGIAYVLVRQLSRLESSSVIIFYFPLVALPMSVVLLGSDFVMPDMLSLVLLILVGIFTQIGQVGLTKAMQYEGAGKAMAYSYMQVVFALVFGWAIFGELPSFVTFIGGGLIISGVLINVFWRR